MKTKKRHPHSMVTKEMNSDENVFENLEFCFEKERKEEKVEVEENEEYFRFFKNIKIHSEEKCKVSKICCTQNYLFVALSNIHTEVHIFNFENIVSSSSGKELCVREFEDGDDVSNESNESDVPNEYYSNETNTEKEKEKGMGIEKGKKKKKEIDMEIELKKDENMKKEKSKDNEDEYEYIDLTNVIVYNTSDTNSEEKNEESTKREKRNLKNKKDRCHKNRKGTYEYECYDLKLKEEFLYYDNFLGINKKGKGKGKAKAKEKENMGFVEIIKEEDEEKKKKKIEKEKEEEMNKEKKKEEEILKNEELQKKGYYIHENNIEINIDILKKKNNKTIGNYIEYIGCLLSLPSPILLMKTNKSGSLLCILTFDGSIYTYDVTKEKMLYFEEKRSHKEKMFSNMDRMLSREMHFKKNTETSMKGNKTEDFLLNEEELLQPLSVSNSYHISSIKSIDFLPDDETLICVGLNKEFVLSFINCKDGKKIIYNNKIKIKKSNVYNVPFTLIYNFNCIYVEKEKKNFYGEMGYFTYIGSTCGYLVFFFLSEKFLKFVYTLLNSVKVPTNSVFIYKKINEVLNYSLSNEKKEMDEKEITPDFQKENVIESVLTGNIDDIYKMKKEDLYKLFDSNNTTNKSNNMKTMTTINATNTNTNNINNNINNDLNNNDINNIKDSFFSSEVGENYIFKNISQHFFFCPFLISKNVQINHIISDDKTNCKININEMNKIETNKIETNKIETNKIETNKIETNKIETNKIETNKIETNKIEINKIIVGLNDGRVILFYFKITNDLKNKKTFVENIYIDNTSVDNNGYTSDLHCMFNKQKETLNGTNHFDERNNHKISPCDDVDVDVDVDADTSSVATFVDTDAHVSFSPSSFSLSPSLYNIHSNKKEDVLNIENTKDLEPITTTITTIPTVSNDTINEKCRILKDPHFLNSRLETLDKFTYDLTGLHNSSTIKTIHIYKKKNSVFSKNKKKNENEKELLLINTNVKKISEMSDKNFYTTYIINMNTKKIKILHNHLSQLLDSTFSSMSSFYFCLNDNDTIVIFSPSVINQ